MEQILDDLIILRVALFKTLFWGPTKYWGRVLEVISSFEIMRLSLIGGMVSWGKNRGLLFIASWSIGFGFKNTDSCLLLAGQITAGGKNK